MIRLARPVLWGFCGRATWSRIGGCSFLEGEQVLCQVPLPPSLQSATGVFLRTGPCNTTPTAPNPSVAGFANFRLQQNNKVFRSAVYHRPRAVTWTALGCHATSWVWNIPPPLATWLPVSHTGQSCQEWSQKGLKEEPSGEVCPEVSLHSPVGYIIDEHTINFLTK